MKSHIVLTVAVFFGLLAMSCTSEPAILDLEISVSSTEANAGDPVLFTFTGDTDFLTFYSGETGKTYAQYPNAIAQTVNLVSGETTFAYTYSNLNETVTATFIAASHGNWGEESKMEQFDFDLNIADNRTGITSFTVKTGGLFGKQFEGVINEENSSISVIVDPGTPLTAMTTIISTESTLAELYLNGTLFENKSKVDYSGEDVVFQVRAAGGSIQEWIVLITTL
ncbi:MAG: DUF5017 domain-containing protein [Bacteroidota bacterium]